MDKKNGLDFLKELRAYGKEVWFTKLVDLLVYKKGTLSEKDRDLVKSIILGQGGVDDIEDAEIENENEPTNSQVDYSIVKLHNISNVGALKHDSEASFSPNLTVFYGRNGAGKSSYFKALSVFSKRPYNIKGYINENENNDPNEKKITVSYLQRNDHLDVYYNPTQSVSTLSQEWISTDKSFISKIKDGINIYDNQNIDIVIEKGKNLDWKLEPFKLHYFDLLIKEIENIQAFFESKINENNKAKQFVEKSLTQIVGSTVMQDFSTGALILSSEFFTPFSVEESSRYHQLKSKKQELEQNSIDKISLLENEKRGLLKILEDLKSLSYKEQLLAKKENLMREIQNKKQHEGEQQINALKNFELAHINRSGWNEFILQAVNFIDTFDYPQASDSCIFCNQLLNDSARELVQKYKNIFKIDNQLDLLENELTQVSRQISQLEFVESRLVQQISDLPEENQIYFSTLLSAPTKTELFKNNEQIEAYSEIITEKINFKQREIEQYRIVQGTRTTELKILQEELNNFEVKDKALCHIESFTKLYDYIKENANHLKIVNALSTQKSNITKKQNEATTKLQIEKFNELFNEELLFYDYKLNIDSKVKKGKLDRKYFGESLKEILSEGEKNLIGLADFFAEVNYYSDNKNPIILDDPITSFDLEKIEMLSERILQESKHRQVIVFTHSKPFLTSLRNKVSFKKDADNETKCKLCTANMKCHSSSNIFCSKFYEVYSYSGLSGILVEVLPYQTPQHLKEKIEGILSSPYSSTINTLEGYLYLRLMIEFFIDTCLLNSVRSRLDPENDNILWDKLPGLKILKDNDGKTGSNSIIRKMYSKISGISVHVDKKNQAVSFYKSDLLDDLKKMKTMNNDFNLWYLAL